MKSLTVNQRATAKRFLRRHGPGLATGIGLTLGIAGVSIALTRIGLIWSLPSLIVALFLGALVGNIAPLTSPARSGIGLMTRWFVRLGIVVLGLGISLEQLISVGWVGALTAVLAVVVTLAATLGMGRLIGLDRGQSLLISGGTAICGASAILAINDISRASTSSVAAAVGVVTLLGMICMLLYPALAHWLSLPPNLYGVWVGASIHEVAQVTVAGAAYGNPALEIATLVKLVRVILLAPVVALLGVLSQTGSTKLRPPGFVIGFAAMIVLGNSGVFPSSAIAVTPALVSAAFTIAMAGTGLQLRLDHLRHNVMGPMLLCSMGTLLISGLSFLIASVLIGGS